MNLNEFNNLIDLYFYQAEKQNSKSIFLEWLNPKNKVKFTWEETSSSIYKLADTIKENVQSIDFYKSKNKNNYLILGLCDYSEIAFIKKK